METSVDLSPTLPYIRPYLDIDPGAFSNQSLDGVETSGGGGEVKRRLSLFFGGIEDLARVNHNDRQSTLVTRLETAKWWKNKENRCIFGLTCDRGGLLSMLKLHA